MSDEIVIARRSLIRRAWPWLLGLAILVVVATRVPVAEFRRAVTAGPHVALGLATVAITTAVLCTDSFSTWIGLIALRMRRPLAHVFVIRGATYLLFLVNYALGQGAFGYYLNRTGVSGLRAVGATLFLIGTNLATLLVVTSIAWAMAPTSAHHGALYWTLVVGCVGYVVYLILIALAGRWFSSINVLAPLFESGVRGHVVAMVGRLPHAAMMIMGYWIALRVWGVEVPITVALTLMPAVVIASVLPISPAGLGTTQAALVYFFSDYAAGTPEQRHAYVLAFAIVYFVYTVVSSLAIGLVCTQFAKRRGLLPEIAKQSKASS